MKTSKTCRCGFCWNGVDRQRCESNPRFLLREVTSCHCISSYLIGCHRGRCAFVFCRRDVISVACKMFLLSSLYRSNPWHASSYKYIYIPGELKLKRKSHVLRFRTIASISSSGRKTILTSFYQSCSSSSL